jgi:GNAT superfamily N-acetyltransferase
MTMRLSTFIGREMTPLLPDLARLCTIVFREWPHLYEGDGRYDADHLQALADSPRAALIIAYDGGVPVGASTCLPLEDATVNVQEPFLARAWAPERFFYFAETVLLPPYRGRGLGTSLLAMQEAHARAVSTCEFACFCTVQRPPDHRARPVGMVPQDGLWRRLGYAPVPGLQCRMTWKEIGAAGEAEMILQFWAKQLSGAVPMS